MRIELIDFLTASSAAFLVMAAGSAAYYFARRHFERRAHIQQCRAALRYAIREGLTRG